MDVRGEDIVAVVFDLQLKLELPVLNLDLDLAGHCGRYGEHLLTAIQVRLSLHFEVASRQNSLGSRRTVSLPTPPSCGR